ncbi:MAG TPA: AAA family ATPase [Nocardioidaceae bacterium]
MLRISLLGEQTISEGTARVLSRSGRSLGLVGYLVLHAGVPQPRQRLAGLFWPDSTDAQALTNLRRELHHLRRALGGDGSLEATSTDLCWRDTESCRVDVRTLEEAHGLALRAARAGDVAEAVRRAMAGIEAYAGDFLPGVYDDWALAARDRLRRDCVELCDLVTHAWPRQGDLATCVDVARKRIALEPLEEPGYRVLMGLQVEMGDRGGAISTYHHCAAVLERELGVAPDPETQHALDRLIGDGPPRAAPPRAGASGTPLLGRDEAMSQALAHWRRASTGRAGVTVVRGPAGIGKSRLVAELAIRARAEGAVVATARCFDTSGRIALAPLGDWLRDTDLLAAARGLDPVWRAEVARLVPDVGDALPAWSSGERAMVDSWQRHRFFEGLAQPFLAEERPLLLVLDDLQWCDEETLAWVSYLLGRAPDKPLLVAVTLREEDAAAGTAGDRWLARVPPDRLVRVSLTPLDTGQTARLAEALTGRLLEPDAAALLHATTGGFPLYVVEATRAGDGSSSGDTGDLGAVLRLRVGQTSPEAQEVAALAAAVGRDFSLDLITEASDRDAATVARGVDELWRRRIVRELGAGYDFSHDLLREAAYELVSPPRRWLLHRRLAQALELSSPETDGDLAGQLAEQYDRGGRADRALPYYRRAADVAAARFAHAEAVRLHRQALRMVAALPPGDDRDRRELDTLLAMAAPLNALDGFASAQQQEALERAVDLAEQVGSDATLIRSLLSLWTSRFVQGRVREAHGISARAMSMAGVDEVLLGQAHFAFAGTTVTLGRPEEAVAHFEIAHERCVGSASLPVGTMPEVHALAWAAHAHWLLGDTDLAAYRAAEAVERARAIAHLYSLAVALGFQALTGQMLDDRDLVAASVSELADLCARHDFAYYPEWGLVLRGWLQGGRDGVAMIHRGIGNLRAQRSHVRMPYWLSLLADALLGCGMTEDAEAALDAARSTAEQRGDAWWLPEVIRMRAALSSPDSAGALLESALRLAEEQGSHALADRCRADLANRANTGANAAANAGRTPPS